MEEAFLRLAKNDPDTKGIIVDKIKQIRRRRRRRRFIYKENMQFIKNKTTSIQASKRIKIPYRVDASY